MDKENELSDKIEIAKKSSKKKKIILGIIITLVILVLVFVGCFIFNRKDNSNTKKNSKNVKILENGLPKPEITGGERGELGIDKNINESTIDLYLNRDDSVYRDMRMLEDPGKYENIGGDSFLSGFIDGFEVIPLPYIIPVNGLPSEVGDTYIGPTLFREEDGIYIANYEESYDIIESVFPKDKNIFLMCGGGGYAGITKKFLISLGWDENKIYNIGGYWYYHGDHNITVKHEVDGKITYNFDIVPYHNIDFDSLTESENYIYQPIPLRELKFANSKIEILENKSYFLNSDILRLPNGAEYSDIIWKSSDSSIVSVNDYGLIVSHKPGKAIITAESQDNKNIKATCTIIVNKAKEVDPIKLDDISVSANEFNSYDYEELYANFEKKVYNSDGSIKREYYTLSEDGHESFNDLWNQEYDVYEKETKVAYNNRLRIINDLVDNKKSFIIIQYNRICDAKDYYVYEGAKRVLESYNLPSLFVYNDGRDDVLYDSKLDHDKMAESDGSIIIINNGEVFEVLDSNVYSLNNDEDTEIWLKKFVIFEFNE